MFVDNVRIRVRAGKGGDGLMSWRREKFIDKGGPDGGDGGNGGSVYLLADHNTNTLASFRHSPLISAGDGENGRRQRAHGKSGQDKEVKVPVGTVVLADGQIEADLTADGQRLLLAQGGKGGFGNAHFTSSTRQAPRVAESGEPGQERELQLELKLIADVGLVGLPNAGKSTLLSVISNAKPEVADYPFTTLAPNLGVADIDDTSLLVADIPGLIKGASKGKGLGDEFLRHIERTPVLLHLVDANEKDAPAAYKTIKAELKDYQVNLSKKPQLVVLTKADTLDEQSLKTQQQKLRKASKQPVYVISAVAHKNITELLRAVSKLVRKQQKPSVSKRIAAAATPVITLADDPNAWWIEKPRAGVFVIKGRKVEGFGRRTNFRTRAGEQRFRDILHKLGIDRELIRLDISIGDTIQIASKSFKW